MLEAKRNKNCGWVNIVNMLMLMMKLDLTLTKSARKGKNRESGEYSKSD